MEKDEFIRDKEREARIGVKKARGFFQVNPLKIITPDETTENILLGMKFQVTNINFMSNAVTFTLVE